MHLHDEAGRGLRQEGKPAPLLYAPQPTTLVYGRQGGGKPRPIGVKLRMVEFIDAMIKSDSCEKIEMKICPLSFPTGVN